MIFLTSDVHHMSLKGVDQRFLSGTETAAARRYNDLIQKFALKNTMFISGRCVDEHPRDIAAIAQCPFTEIGGHNYACFRPLKFYQLYGRITGLKNGPYSVQDRDVKKTADRLLRLTGRRIVSWRNHGYRGDRNTSKILAANGISFRSDLNDLGNEAPFFDGHVTNIPINTLPDHDFVNHGPHVEAYVEKRRRTMLRWRPSFPRNMTAAEWLYDTLSRLEKVQLRGGVSTILIHPACMEVIDGFDTVEQLFKSLKVNLGPTSYVNEAEI